MGYTSIPTCKAMSWPGARIMRAPGDKIHRIYKQVVVKLTLYYELKRIYCCNKSLFVRREHFDRELIFLF